MDDDALIDYWIAYQTTGGSTEKSIRERVISIRAMLRRTGRTLLTVTRHDLIRDLGRPGLAPSTRSHYKSLMHLFFCWLQDEGFRLDNPAVKLPKVRVPATEPDPVTTEDIETVLHGGMYRRARLWVLLYAYQGFRAAEIAAVSDQSIDWGRKRILSVDGKAGKEVWRPIHPLVWEHLQQWRGSGQWFFPSYTNRGEHVRAGSVSKTLSAAFRRAGVRHRPHQLRAWFASELIDAGASKIVVAAAMRHSNEQTVQKYARVKDDRILAAMVTLPVVRVPVKSGRKVA